jgi:hypothetical protein
MAVKMKPINPKLITKGMELFREDGTKVSVLDILLQNGVYKWTTFHNVNGKNWFNDYEYDMHDYDGSGGDPLPELYKKNPTGGK